MAPSGAGLARAGIAAGHPVHEWTRQMDGVRFLNLLPADYLPRIASAALTMLTVG
jgi:hypothetical protein